MGKHSEKQNETPAAKNQNPGAVNGVIVIRLIVAALIFAASLLFHMPAFLSLSKNRL